MADTTLEEHLFGQAAIVLSELRAARELATSLGRDPKLVTPHYLQMLRCLYLDEPLGTPAEELGQAARLRNCPTHGQQSPEAWGCPECVRELREELAAARLHQPTPPAEGEVAELVAWLRDKGRGAWPAPDGLSPSAQAEEYEFYSRLTRAAEPLQQQHPTPVPVSEGLPGEGDLDAEGTCWVWNRTAYTWGLFQLDLTAHSHWLRAHALPLPLPLGEVEG